MKERAYELFGIFYEQYFPRLYGYVRYRVRDVATAEDITASVFLRLVQHLDNLRKHDEGVWGRWIFTTAHNLIIDHYRARQESVSIESLAEAGWQPHSGEEQELAVLRQDNLETIRRLVRELDERAQNVIGLRFAGELTNRQIARVTGLSEANVAQILHRALRRLKERLKEES